MDGILTRCGDFLDSIGSIREPRFLGEPPKLPQFQLWEFFAPRLEGLQVPTAVRGAELSRTWVGGAELSRTGVGGAELSRT